MSADPNMASAASNDSRPSSAAGENSPLFSGTSAPAWQVWLWRTRALLFVTLCATLGVLLVILPWTPHWTDNPLLLTSPELREIVSSGFTRGFASGLGLLDLWLGFWEAVHYHEN